MVLLLPFLLKKVGDNLEAFLFIMGILAISISGMWSKQIIKEAFIEPIKITIAVAFAGLLFKKFQVQIRNNIDTLSKKMGHRLFLFSLIVVLGLFSSVITAIIASLVLVEVISGLKFEKKLEKNVVVIGCFAIGLGAALTPIGEPLSTIAIYKLNANFWYLAKLIGIYIIPEVLILGLIAFSLTSKINNKINNINTLTESKEESTIDILFRTAKVYIFIMALIFLSAGFKPIIDYVVKLPATVLYWINTSSAIIDNATLTAAEINIKMTQTQIKAVLMGLLISGGMLIPGNIPNIISAGKLKISPKEWGVFGVPLGLIFMLVNFIILFVF